MSRFSIFIRLVFLATALIGVLFVSNLLLGRELSRNAEALAEEARFVGALHTANAANKAFGDLKYWLTDLAVSLLVRSEKQAQLARERLAAELNRLEAYDPETVSIVRSETAAVLEQGMQAVDAYTEDQRVLGNSLMAAARVHIVTADQRLAGLDDRLKAKALERRDSALAAAEQAVGLSTAIVVGATVLGLILTWMVLRSITGPLRRLVVAMTAITDGNLEVAIPAPSRDEIGVMARTLALFRDSLRERARLEAERERAEGEVRNAQARLSDAIESISEGFSLYDPKDRLVVCNSRYREMLYAGMADMVAPGTTFEEIVREAAEKGLIPEAAGRIEEWVAARVAKHRAPGRPHEHQRSDDRWVRVTESKTSDGGTVAVYTDITEDKRSEAQLRSAKEEAERALKELTQTQESLIHSEKMASLGQLTAGIAHEIKNPLNFVNNFAGVSTELLAELKEELEALNDSLSEEQRENLWELIETVSGNLGKIEEHGARADGIVKSMLSHAREGPGSMRETDLNSLIDESLNLAYHGARAENRSFNVTLERAYDPAVGELTLYPQEMTRVFLNLIGNAFYATQKRYDQTQGTDYRPSVRVSTEDLGQTVAVRVRDNGTGMADSVLEKVFTPFFTTKSVGEGTGLGLSLSYDIVVNQHHGRLEVESEQGEFTEFLVTLPRRMS